MRPQWPLSEAWCRGALLAHKPTLRHADVKGHHSSHIEAFKAFLLNPPDNASGAAVKCLAEEVRAAAVAAARGVASSAAESASGRGQDAPSGMLGAGAGPDDDDRPEVPESSGDFADEPLSADEARALREADGGLQTTAHLGHFDFQTLKGAFREQADQGVRSLNAISPQMANAGQRAFLCDQVEHALRAYEADGDHWRRVRRVFLVGLAGTGKTFTIDLLAAALVAITGKAAALAAFCPTGAAAGAARGRTADAALGVRRTKKDYEPLKDDKLARLQEENLHTHCAVFDEAWMNGSKLLGHISAASKQVMRGGAADADDDYIGSGVGVCVLAGDPKQLPPVKDKLAFADVQRGDSMLGMTGQQLYRSVRRAWFLDQPMRQAHGPLFDALTAVRDGEVGDHAAFFMRLRLADMDQAEKDEFTGGRRTLYATCFNKDRDAVNAKYIMGLEAVRVVKATLSGNHVQTTNARTGPASAIPLVGYYTEGMMVKLTANLLPPVGLYNGARGYVVAVVYASGYKKCGAGATAETDMPVVVVDFPGYTGEPWFETAHDEEGSVVGDDRRTWVPIAPQERRCEKGCCNRTGLPLVTAKADSVHCCQGMSVGQGKAIEKLIGLWSADAERRWPGIFYVLVSRVQDAANIRLAPAGGGSVVLSAEAFRQIGKGDAWAKTHAEANGGPDARSCPHPAQQLVQGAGRIRLCRALERPVQESCG